MDIAKGLQRPPGSILSPSFRFFSLECQSSVDSSSMLNRHRVTIYSKGYVTDQMHNFKLFK